MKYRISEDMLSQMVFYNVLQCMREHCVPKEYLNECLIDVSAFDDGILGKSDSGEPFTQGALICTKNHIEEKDPPIISILRSTHTICITFPKLIPDVMMFIRISHGAVVVDSSGKDPMQDEMFELVQYFGKAVSNCLLNILPQGSDIYFKDDFRQTLKRMLNELIASLPDDDADDDDADVNETAADETDE